MPLGTDLTASQYGCDNSPPDMDLNSCHLSGMRTSRVCKFNVPSTFHNYGLSFKDAGNSPLPHCPSSYREVDVTLEMKHAGDPDSVHIWYDLSRQRPSSKLPEPTYLVPVSIHNGRVWTPLQGWLQTEYWGVWMVVSIMSWNLPFIFLTFSSTRPHVTLWVTVTVMARINSITCISIRTALNFYLMTKCS